MRARVYLMLPLLLIVFALLLWLGVRIPIIGKLPGDLTIRRPGFTIYLPLGTSFLVSVLLSLLWRILKA